MELVQYISAGTVAGLIVASWHSFKDPPWEGFHLIRFFRSIISGGVIGSLLYAAQRNGLISVNNVGEVGLAVVCLERGWGEVLKGFFKIRVHPEYLPMFTTYNVPYTRYILKLLIGTIFTVLVSALLLYYIRLPYVLSAFIKNRTVLGALCGLIGGLTIAAGGAFKDSPAEGFKPSKFIRSPLAGIAGGIVIISFTQHLDLLMYAIMGFERIGVEFYKTFYTRSKRGMFKGKDVINPGWFKIRWLFFITYALAVFYTLFHLINQK